MRTGNDAGGRAAPAAEPERWWRQGGFPFFIASRALSITGDMAAVSALTVHIFQGTASGLAVSGLFVVRVLPRLFGALAGGISDRTDLRRLLIACDLVAGLVFALVAWSQPGYQLILALVLVAESAATVAAPAGQALVARTVPPYALGRANGTVMAVTAIGFASGAAIGSLSASTWGYQYALLVNALSFALSAGLVAVIPRVPPVAREDGDDRGFVATTLAGLGRLRRDRRVTGVAVAMIGVTFAGSLDRPALVMLTQRDLDASSLAYGLALGGISIGALLATLLMGRSRLFPASVGVLLAGLSVQAAGHLTMGLAPVVTVVVAGAVVAGFGNGMEGISGTTLLQRAAGNSVGLLMGVVMSGSYLADAVGSLLGGLLVGAAGARWTFVVSAVLMIACALSATRITGDEHAGPSGGEGGGPPT
ncbi:MFS transporter [Streptosporangium carneum]|uniref:Major facilitator superfamily (MFS) profile domain-containing protein n=1 Tax=Streptosporangium carneum TaxID=47481 RepID=A0A9W6I615_9ACTN|nr:MFS transporter [Streptosporangium carneum]GLK12767.1 hypothetical protein GCM10017600_61770 [Streptosporangium carneum]